MLSPGAPRGSCRRRPDVSWGSGRVRAVPSPVPPAGGRRPGRWASRAAAATDRALHCMAGHSTIRSSFATSFVARSGLGPGCQAPRSPARLPALNGCARLDDPSRTCAVHPSSRQVPLGRPAGRPRGRGLGPRRGRGAFDDPETRWEAVAPHLVALVAGLAVRPPRRMPRSSNPSRSRARASGPAACRSRPGPPRTHWIVGEATHLGRHYGEGTVQTDSVDLDPATG